MTSKNLISYSLWGNDNAYICGLEDNIERAMHFYPEWEVVAFVHIDTIALLGKSLLKRSNFNLVPVSLKADWSGMFWRMLPILWGSSKYVLVRDLDSRLSNRESLAVKAWIESGKSLHIMRDHPAHSTAIMGGMFGVDASSHSVRVAFRNLKRVILQCQCTDTNEYWQVDQCYLAEAVYPNLRNHALVHDEFFEGIPFPSKRDGLEFVGEAVGRSDNNDRVCETQLSLLRVLQYIESKKFMLSRFNIDNNQKAAG